MASINMLITILVFLILAIDKTEGIPTISFPINAQVPPVAHGGTYFDFTFSDITFSNASSNMSYSMTGAASWLNLDSAHRRFSGTPSDDDEEVMAFDLIATDSTGSASMPVSFLVTNALGPQLSGSANISVLLSGVFSGSRSITLSPGATVDVTLNSSIFVDTNTTTQYYAVCSDNSPLPSWLIFDPSDLSFSGAVPGANSPSELPQVYDLRVIATDTPGFSSAAYPIRITVDLHLLLFDNERIDINVTAGQAFNYTSLKNDLKLDGQVIDLNLISGVQSQAPSWLSVDTTNLAISGTPPQDFTPLSFWIAVNDTYGDDANTTIFLTSSNLPASDDTEILGTTIPSIIVFPGQNVSYTIPTSAFLSNDISTSVDLDACLSWLHYTADNLTFTGTAPKDLPIQNCFANLTVNEGSQSAWELIEISIISPNATATSLPPSSSTTATSSATASTWPQPDDSAFNRNAIMSSLIVVGVACVAFALWWCPSARREMRARIAGEAAARRAAESQGESGIDGPATPTRNDTGTAFRLRSPPDSPFAMHPNWYGGPRTASAASDDSSVTANDHTATQHRDSPFPLSTEARGGPERRHGMPLPSARNAGFGHGCTAPPIRLAPVILGSAAPRVPGQASKHQPLFPNCGVQPPKRARPTPSAPTDDSYETIEEEMVPTKATVRPGLAKRALQSLGRGGRRPFVMSQFSIRPVAKSPTPSEMAAPDLTASPRARLQSYVHERATERHVSGLFSSSAAQRDTERDMIVPGPSAQSQASISRISRIRTPILRAPIFNSQILEPRKASGSIASRSPDASESTQALITTMGEDPFYDSPTASKKGKGKQAQHSRNVSLVTNSDDWVDDVPENTAAGAAKTNTSSSNATSYIASSDGIELGSNLHRSSAMFNIASAANQGDENARPECAPRRKSSIFHFL